MWANNEVGTVNPVREIGHVCRERGVIFHTDATQAVGKVPIDVHADFVDLLSFSGHKFYGPKGCGGLFVRRKDPRVRLTPLLDGGGHERGFRSGTLNVPGIVGVGAAAEVALHEMEIEIPRLVALRDRLESGILQTGGVCVNGDPRHRMPHLTNLSFAGLDGEGLVAALAGIAVSSGSACNSASIEASYVLRALGVSSELARNSVRFSLGRSNTREEVDYVVSVVAAAVHRLRGGDPAVCGACAAVRA